MNKPQHNGGLVIRNKTETAGNTTSYTSDNYLVCTHACPACAYEKAISECIEVVSEALNEATIRYTTSIPEGETYYQGKITVCQVILARLESMLVNTE